jgi:hypothetical protein
MVRSLLKHCESLAGQRFQPATDVVLPMKNSIHVTRKYPVVFKATQFQNAFREFAHQKNLF